ncbi:MAG: hypothetical protein H6819_03510 [Phycisphaerales bacterium]|nr:hypothetical protein [Phycisphaerales bacterium]MCB9856264.1 hypothetical protein [Phycisphaerales bacterium]MCB9863297.1 hypothetical protein [Phycisphaerales bacterium]
MKLPNLRLHETQAQFAAILGVLALFCLVALTYAVFRGFNQDMMAIIFNPSAGLGKYRKLGVFAGTAVTLGVGVTAGLLGFNSLGQKRNTKQGMSWLGLAFGALAVSAAPVLLFAWMQLNQSTLG